MPRSDLARQRRRKLLGAGAPGRTAGDSRSGYAGFAAAVLAGSPADAQQTIKIEAHPALFGTVCRSRCPGRQRHQALHASKARRLRLPAGKSRSCAGIPAALRPTWPSVLPRNWWCATRSTCSPASRSRPNALAAADVSAQAKKFMVVMNAAASIVTTKSPYMARVSFTLPQLNEPLGVWAYKNGVRKVYSIVADFAAGHDAEAAFQSAFKAAGGEINRLGAVSRRQPRLLRLRAARRRT